MKKKIDIKLDIGRYRLWVACVRDCAHCAEDSVTVIWVQRVPNDLGSMYSSPAQTVFGFNESHTNLGALLSSPVPLC